MHLILVSLLSYCLFRVKSVFSINGAALSRIFHCSLKWLLKERYLYLSYRNTKDVSNRKLARGKPLISGPPRKLAGPRAKFHSGQL